jgi:hypothetical protein
VRTAVQCKRTGGQRDLEIRYTAVEAAPRKAAIAKNSADVNSAQTAGRKSHALSGWAATKATRDTVEMRARRGLVTRVASLGRGKTRKISSSIRAGLRKVVIAKRANVFGDNSATIGLRRPEQSPIDNATAENTAWTSRQCSQARAGGKVRTAARKSAKRS